MIRNFRCNKQTLLAITMLIVSPIVVAQTPDPATDQTPDPVTERAPDPASDRSRNRATVRTPDPATATLTIEVNGANKPIRHARVSVSWRGSRRGKSAWTDRKGAVTFSKVPLTQVTIVVDPSEVHDDTDWNPESVKYKVTSSRAPLAISLTKAQ